MRFAFSDEQLEFRRGARRFLQRHAPIERTRALLEADGPGFDPEFWRRVCEEQGWHALTIAEELGGFGFGAVELAGLMEECGRALAPTPLLATACLATPLLQADGGPTARELLADVAAGARLLAVAHVDAGAAWWSGAPSTRASVEGDHVRLDGTKPLVVDGHIAQTLLVSATDSAGEVGVYAVDTTTQGLTVARVGAMDATRPRADVTLSGVVVPSSRRVGGVRELRHAAAFASAMLAAESIGVAEASLEMAVEYAKVREQFGRPIGSFQAIKHKCADMLMAVETARSAAYHAAWCAADEPESLPLAARVAAAYVGDAAFACAAENIQIHGGVGFTWEVDAHLYFKRARASRSLFDAPSGHLDAIASLVIDGGGASWT
ncbi:MAG: acyl-CoA/acyl-ACP dehydrogenase [Myxococcales bacterium]|nr:acyl-CoA/acyl-ACP dehydrogenase [Myxococcales bacterium]MCB9532377.1 acyl-CoA/acyl-ACP dehydrogenase [Myxococcales bacterium]